ncbi:kinase-like domain-containing protein [Diaporthe sp. PMI_573]|nr:kinase-like domain-containing protein [Diaporthaceae sp. PMI_573]
MATDQVNLYDVVVLEQTECPGDLGGGSYLSPSVLEQYVTEPQIKSVCRDEGWREDLSVIIYQSARKIFAILHLINQVEILNHIVDCGLRDEHLPLSLSPEKASLISRKGEVTELSFRPFGDPPVKRKFTHALVQFVEKQWTFIPFIFDDSGEHYKCDPKRVMPFLSRKSLGRAIGTEDPDCDRWVFDCTIDAELFCTKRGKRVAVKKLAGPRAFEQEITALRLTRKKNHTSLIRFLSSWEKSDHYYILLPFAEGGTLRDFCANNGPTIIPRDHEFIRKSLVQLLQLIDGIRIIHQDNLRHGDLKPENIFHFTDHPGQLGTFVIADLGISRQHHIETGLRYSKTTTNSSTPVYQAPEVEIDALRDKPLRRRYDVWSVGCILLEYIIWLLWDNDAIRAFNEARGKLAFYSTKKDEADNQIAVDHAKVAEVIGVLRDDPRCGKGTALRDLVDHVQRGMLVVDRDKRYDAEELHDAVSQIVGKASGTGKGEGDAYVLPPEAKVPAVRPEIFQWKGEYGSETS